MWELGCLKTLPSWEPSQSHHQHLTLKMLHFSPLHQKLTFHYPFLTKSTTTMGSTSSDETTIENIQVQTSEGKEIHLEKNCETRSSTTLCAIEMSYQAIQNVSTDLDQNHSPLEEYDLYTSLVWVIDTPNIHDLLDQTFSFDEVIMEVMNIS